MSVPGTVAKGRWSCILMRIIWRGRARSRSDLCTRQKPLAYVATWYSLFCTSHFIIHREVRALLGGNIQPWRVNTSPGLDVLAAVTVHPAESQEHIASIFTIEV
jgi:hypothetical protein